MSTWQRRALDRRAANEKLAETETKINDLTIRRRRLEIDVSTYVFRVRRRRQA